jgi:2-isopropylmalate synthase
VARVAASENVLTIDGEGSGPIEAFVTALVETLNEPVTILSFQEVAIGTGSDAQAICIVSIEDKEEGQRCYGVGISRNTTTTALNAVISAMNRRWGKA